MNIRTPLLISLLFIGTTFLFAQSPKIVVAGSGMNKICLIDKNSKQVEWTYPLPEGSESNCVDMNKEGNLLFGYSAGARFVNMAGETLWDYTVPQGDELHTAYCLPDGGFLLGVCATPSRIIELDKKGAVRKTITFETGIKNVHGQFRQIAKSKKGTYLVPLMGRAELLEVAPDGVIARTYTLPAPSFSVLELKSGNLLLSCGDAHLFAEIDRANGQIVRKIDDAVIGETGVLHFLAQIVQQKNGNLLVSSWNGHYRKGEERQVPHIIELDANNRVVWRYDNHTDIAKVSALYYIEDGKKLKIKQQ